MDIIVSAARALTSRIKRCSEDCHPAAQHSAPEDRRDNAPDGLDSLRSPEFLPAIFTTQNAMDQWAADAGHWEFVLNPLATEMGIGYAYNANSDFGGYFTVDFH